MISPTGLGIRNDIEGSGEYGARRGSRKHAGIDYVCKDGQNIFAPFDMKIDIFEELRGYELITLEECIYELKKLRPEVFDFIKTKVSNFFL